MRVHYWASVVISLVALGFGIAALAMAGVALNIALR